MGKRKSSKKPVAKKQNDPLSTSFKCLFCHHEKAVTVKIDRQAMFGHLHCKICGQKFTSPINNLSVAVDVYCDWVDACEEINVKQPKKAPARPVPPRRSASPEAKASKRQSARDAYSDDDDDNEDGYYNRAKVSRDYDDDDDE